jgi:hypothetical protein
VEWDTNEEMDASVHKPLRLGQCVRTHALHASKVLHRLVEGFPIQVFGSVVHERHRNVHAMHGVRTTRFATPVVLHAHLVVAVSVAHVIEQLAGVRMHVVHLDVEMVEYAVEHLDTHRDVAEIHAKHDVRRFHLVRANHVSDVVDDIDVIACVASVHVVVLDVVGVECDTLGAGVSLARGSGGSHDSISMRHKM